MDLTPLPAPEFDLAQTLNSGQVFHWRAHGAGWVGLAGDVPVYAEQRGAELLVTAGAEAAASRYFALDHRLDEIRASFPADPVMAAAGAACRGIRIIRQPPWECVGTFITSSMKQVAHIRQMSRYLRENYGGLVDCTGGIELYSYPTAERLAGLTAADLRAGGLGYRAENLLGAARAVRDGMVDLDGIESLDYAAAQAALCRLPGVGPKVANCVLLFAYERLQAFPIDVWIERVLREHYFARKRNVTARRLREFSQSYFGEYGGYAQQYLFHHARSAKASRRKPSSRKNAANTRRGPRPTVTGLVH